MTSPGSEAQGSSTRPYLIRALHDWCTDNGFTPYLAVHVDAGVEVPREYVRNNEIVLNVSFDATSQLVLGNDWIEFQARFGGKARQLRVPVDRVIAIYARENGQGMAFPAPTVTSTDGGVGVSGSAVLTDNALAVSASSEGQAGPDGGAGPRLVAESPASFEDDRPPGPSGPSPSPGRPALKRVK